MALSCNPSMYVGKQDKFKISLQATQTVTDDWKLAQ